MRDEVQIFGQADTPDTVRATVATLCRVGHQLSRIIARGNLDQALGGSVGINSDGDGQKALDVIADDAFMAALKDSDVRWYASEEQADVVGMNPKGSLALAIDPLDGSSNIDVNVSIGTIFSIFRANDDADASFLRPANEQIAAGYIIYGPQTALMVTFGTGTLHYVMDPDTGNFHLVSDKVRIKTTSSEFAINASNHRHWSKPVLAYVQDCLAGTEGPRGRNYNMRWIASLVAETHRILSRGGIFLYPSDAREGYEHGRLRMVYECAPIAFLVEQAGGKATDACDPIMAQSATSLHGRTPFVFGSTEDIDRVAAYHDLPLKETSALFGNRGLFRT